MEKSVAFTGAGATVLVTIPGSFQVFLMILCQTDTLRLKDCNAAKSETFETSNGVTLVPLKPLGLQLCVLRQDACLFLNQKGCLL